MTSNFCKFLFGLHRKSDEGSNKKIYSSVFSNLLSNIVILNGLLKGQYEMVLLVIGVLCPNHKNEQGV